MFVISPTKKDTVKGRRVCNIIDQDDAHGSSVICCRRRRNGSIFYNKMMYYNDLIGYYAHRDNVDLTGVLTCSDCSETFLACCVPNL